MKRLKRILGLLVFALLVGGCMSMPLSSMYKLSQLSPLEANPKEMKIAVRTLDIAGIQTGAINMHLGYVAQDGSINIDEDYLVEVENNPLLSKLLLNGIEENEKVTVMQLSAIDGASMQAHQQRIKAYKEAGGEGQGTFSVGVNSICLTGPLPDDELLVDIFLQVSEAESFFIMFEDMDLLQEDEQGELQKLPLCETL